MRNPDRIFPFCNQLAVLWLQYPDLRFGQLMVAYNSYLDIEKRKDVFYIEDDEFIKGFEEYLKRL